MFGWKEILNLFGFSFEFGLSFFDVGSAIGAGASLLGGAMGSEAAGTAGGQQSAAIQQAINEINKIGARTRSDTESYRNLGSAANNKLSMLLGLASPNDWVSYDQNGVIKANPYLYNTDESYRNAYDADLADHIQRYGEGYNSSSTAGGLINGLKQFGYNPDYSSNPEYGSLLKKFSQNDLDNDVVYQNGLQFGLDNGNKAIMNQARALGGADSGSVLKALSRFGNDYASTKAEGAYNRFNTDKNSIYNMLTGQQQVGQSAVNTDASTGANLASALSGASGQLGNAQSAGTVGQANAWSGALGNIGKIASAGGGILDTPVFKW